ncbi:stage IV sporulation protein A [Desulfonispora thiosulfatigenes DSM 11270]|uniref:Stage IV sporulation protein A n=1 Tax=Desulfonispora thiosulfatigenes DSM 11270 TaxID=656914 RepID=A0A1W1VND1_DESTI|nr:stage IV sporulation protein A [Desulfonispora thiosulfatigenes]SMB94464.1 stage IV sporulation protein A [Desulfonispora thiosulfatigenes DSM 11270]
MNYDKVEKLEELEDFENYTIFEDIANRTGGNIYVSAVGPVRTGKSTFIKKFMDLIVLPAIEDKYDKERTIDSLPQSGAGKTIMTTEPKFVPDEAVQLQIRDGINVKVRLVDCVGYSVEGALGYEEADGPRMVRTPWAEDPVPFHEAAEIGTRKVITDHSTIGLVITADGSFNDIPRENYIDSEQRVVSELKELNKPFIVLLNTINPEDQETLELAESLEKNYDVPVIPMNIAQMEEEELMRVMEEVLFEFPVAEVNISLPKWIEELENEHWLRAQFEDAVHSTISEVKRLRDIDNAIECLAAYDFVNDVVIDNMDMGTGIAHIKMSAEDSLFYRVYKEITGEEVAGLHDIINLTKVYVDTKREYDKVESALLDVKETGYGMVAPTLSEMSLEEPELFKKSGNFGVKLKASAPTLHIIRSDITTEITPMMGSEKQCEDLVRYLLEKFEENPTLMWNYDIFGKSLHDLVNENIQGKLQKMPENVQRKLQEALKRVVNDGSGGLICIII